MALGFDPIWFGIILVKLNGIATLSPPVGLVVFVVNGVRPDIPVRDIFRGIGPFIVADIITIAVLTAFPRDRHLHRQEHQLSRPHAATVRR